MTNALLTQPTAEDVFEDYALAALWTDLEDDDDATIHTIAESARAKALADITTFLDQAAAAGLDLLDLMSVDMIGYDLWLTRNHHGVGFWDRGLGDAGKRLTDIAHDLGESDAIVGDDGLVYF